MDSVDYNHRHSQSHRVGERVINVWDSLPKDVDFSSLLRFKHSIQRVDFSSFMKCFKVYIPIFMCNALVSVINKATVNAPCEPCMSCQSGVQHYVSK